MSDIASYSSIPSGTPVPGLTTHILREELYAELHSRPSPIIHGSCKVVQLTLLLGSGQINHEHLVELCEYYEQPAPASSNSCFYQNFNQFELRFERHSEFANYTFIFPSEAPFEHQGLNLLPEKWLASLPGELVAATQVVFLNSEPQITDIQQWFEGLRTTGAHVAELSAKVWTSFSLHSDGFGRMLVFNKKLSPYQSGRLLQRLLEVETYRLMSLLALPIARQTGRDLGKIEDSLASLNQKISAIHIAADERELLQEVSLLAADIEHRRSSTNFRFSAAVAYHDLVNDRLLQLKEEPLEGMQSLQEFLQRRLTPGVKTVNAVSARLEDISKRIAQTTNLLQARVDLAIQEQNQDLLVSMNRRSQLQLRLQQTVEGLSVAAISYYLVGLLGFTFDGMHSLFVDLNATLLKGITAPLVVLAVFFGVRRVRAHITKQAKK